MDQIDDWLLAQTGSPAGAILVMLAIFISRIMIDRWSRKRAARAKTKKKATNAK